MKKKTSKRKIDKRFIIFLVICFVILIVLVVFNVVFRSQDDNEVDVDNIHYLSGVEDVVVRDSNDISEGNGIITSKEEYNKFVKANNIDSNSDLDFNKYNYLYYVLTTDSCAERVLGVSEVKYSGDTATSVFEVRIKCGVCAPITTIYYVPVDKDKVINNIKDDYNYHGVCNSSPGITYKPILYLYSEKDIDVRVKIEHPEYLMTTYPKYNDGWNVHVLKDGSMYDINNKYYYALYWDEVQVHKVDFREGFYVDGDNAIEFLEEKLSIIGLNDRERNEFIMYWLPKLEDNGKSLVYFELTEEVEKYNKLDIKPVPDSMLRVIIHIKRVDKKVSIKEEKLETFNRIGFSVVEWGGTLYN